jgi:hypothetical protein
MNARSKTSTRTTSKGSPNATSLRVLECGPLPYDALGGLTLAQFGQALAPANLSPRQAKAMGLLTSGISGRRGSISLASVGLAKSLESRLQAATASTGSILFTLTWKTRVTPAGLPICALRASAPRTSDLASGLLASWPTPQTQDVSGGGQAKRAMGDTRHGSAGVGKMNDLPNVAYLSGWATPNARDEKVGSMTTYRERGGGAKGDSLSNQAASLCGSVQTTAAAPPGLLPTGSTAETANTGQLNPGHSRWLMALPHAWDACGVTAMPSARKQQRRSSKQPA